MTYPTNHPGASPTTQAETDAQMRDRIGDIAYGRRALTALALELPETVHRDVSALFGPLLDELEARRGPRTANGGVSFGEAIAQLKLGAKVRRAGWNGKGMYLYLASDLTTRAQ